MSLALAESNKKPQLNFLKHNQNTEGNREEHFKNKTELITIVLALCNRHSLQTDLFTC
jgi:hypothetical protein